MGEAVTALAAGLSYATAGLSVGAATAVVAAVDVAINLAASYLISTAVNSLTGGSASAKQSDINTELSLPTSTPSYRFQYGETRATGTLIAAPVRGDYAYGVWLLNSRPSEGDFTLYLDEREVVLTGDPYDFTGDGATATEDPFLDHVNVYFGLGDQTTVPSIFLDDAPYATGEDEELFKTTDVGQGLTLIWMRWRAGSNDERLERWPSTPPLVEVEGKFTKVYDPRDVSQDFNDPDTWEWSDNQALVCLDILTQNPFRPYQEKNLLLTSFSEAADVADEVVTNKNNSTNARYVVAGVVVFDGSELEDILEPVLNAGAAMVTRVAGKLGLVAGTYQGSSYVLDDVIGDIKYSSQKASNDLPTQVHVSYTSRARNYETAELEPYDIPDALELDGGIDKVVEFNLSWVPTAQQAMRVRKILALRARRQKTLEVMAPPSAIKVVGGATLTTQFPDPYTRFNQEWTVLGTNSALDLLGTEGVALRNQLSLIENSEDIYAYDPNTEEEEVENPTYYSDRKSTRPPSNLVATLKTTDNGSTITNYFDITFDPSPSTGVDGYEVEFGVPVVFLPTTYYGQPSTTSTTARVGPIDPTLEYNVRIRGTGSSGRSEWVYLNGLEVNFEMSFVNVTGGVGEVTFTGTTPSVSFKGIRIYRNSVGGSFDTATQVGGTTVYDPDTSITHVVTGETAGTYDYWIVPVTISNANGPEDGPHTTTIT